MGKTACSVVEVPIVCIDGPAGFLRAVVLAGRPEITCGPSGNRCLVEPEAIRDVVVSSRG